MKMERKQADLGRAARLAALNATMAGLVRVPLHAAKKPKPKPRPVKPGY